MERDQCRSTDRNKLAEAISGVERGSQHPPQQDGEQGKDDDPAHETKLLPNGGEDEVRGLLRHKAEIGLGPVEETLAQHAAGPDGDFALLQVVLSVDVRAARIEKGGQPGDLIRLDRTNLEQRHRTHSGNDHEGRHLPEAGAGNKEHHHGDDSEGKHGAKVGLKKDQNGWYANDQNDPC